MKKICTLSVSVAMSLAIAGPISPALAQDVYRTPVYQCFSGDIFNRNNILAGLGVDLAINWEVISELFSVGIDSGPGETVMAGGLSGDYSICYPTFTGEDDEIDKLVQRLGVMVCAIINNESGDDGWIHSMTGSTRNLVAEGEVRMQVFDQPAQTCMFVTPQDLRPL
ncbi:hypothetical protein AAD018_011450 [Aestuariibius insulae]|uniref:hypothetical protein n=1 Tax=Aestuariibius insulae TaxID=2058287 RepID=UPI00345E9DDE